MGKLYRTRIPVKSIFRGERGFASFWRTRLIFYTQFVWRGAPSTTSKGTVVVGFSRCSVVEHVFAATGRVVAILALHL